MFNILVKLSEYKANDIHVQLLFSTDKKIIQNRQHLLFFGIVCSCGLYNKENLVYSFFYQETDRIQIYNQQAKVLASHV